MAHQLRPHLWACASGLLRYAFPRKGGRCHVKSKHEEKGETFYRSERSYGSFYRLIPLPEGVSPDSVNATFHDGVLEVTMKAPARPKVEPRHVEIKNAAEAKVQTKAA